MEVIDSTLIDSKYNIKITDVQGPWSPDELDFKTSGSHTINLIENIDDFTLGITGPLEISEDKNNIVYKLVLDKPVNTNLIITLLDENGDVENYTLMESYTELNINKPIQNTVDYYKSNNSTKSLRIVKVELSNGKEFEQLNINPIEAVTTIIDKIDATKIHLEFLDTITNTKIETGVIESKVRLKAYIDNLSSHSYKLTLSNNMELIIPTGGEVLSNEIILPNIAGAVEVTITNIEPMNGNNIVGFDDVDLESVIVGNSATINVGYPDSNIIRVEGPAEILEGVPFNVIVRALYSSYGGDIILGDYKGNSITIPEGSSYVEIPFSLSEDYFKNEDFKFSITSVSDKAGFSNIDISGTNLDWPTTRLIPIKDNPTNNIKIDIQYGSFDGDNNSITHYFKDKQSTYNGTTTDELIPIKISLTTMLGDIETKVECREDISGQLTNSINDFDFVILAGTNELLAMVDTNYLTDGIQNITIKSADMEQFEEHTITNTSLSYEIHSWRQTLIRLNSNQEEYVEGSGTAIIEILTDLEPLNDMGINIIINDVENTEYIIPVNNLKTTFEVQVDDDDPYVNINDIEVAGLLNASYYGNPTPDLPLHEKDFQAVYISQDGLIIKIVDTIDTTYTTLSFPDVEIESGTTQSFTYSLSNAPDPSAPGDIVFELDFINSNNEIMETQSYSITEQAGTLEFITPFVEDDENYTINLRYISGGNYEAVVVNDSSIVLKLVGSPNRNAVAYLSFGDNIAENDNPFEITAYLKNTDNANLKPRIENLELTFNVDFEGTGTSYTKTIYIPAANINDIGGDYKYTIDFSDEAITNDVYKDTSPKVSCYFITNPNSVVLSDHMFDSMVFEHTENNPIEIIPEDYIDTTTLKITDYSLSSFPNNIVQNNGILGSTVDILINIDNYVGTETLLAEIHDDNNNKVGEFTLTGNQNTVSVTVTPLTLGEFKPKIIGTSGHNFENLEIDNSLLNIDSLLIRERANVDIGLDISELQVSEDGGSNKTGLFTINSKINNIIIPAYGSLDAITLDESEYSSITDIISEDLTITYKISDDNNNITNNSFIVTADPNTGNTLIGSQLTQINNDNIDNVFISNSEKLTLTPISILGNYENVNLHLNTNTSIINLIDEEIPDQVILSIVPNPNETNINGEYFVQESGDYFNVIIGLSYKTDIALDLKLKVNTDNGSLKDDLGNDIIIDCTIEAGTDQASTSVAIPNIDDIYKGSKLGKIYLEPDLENTVSNFEQLILDENNNKITLSVSDIETKLYFSMYLDEDGNDENVNYKESFNNTTGYIRTDSSMLNFPIIFQGFYILDENNQPEYKVLEANDEITFKLKETIVLNSTDVTFRDRIVTIRGDKMEPILNYNTKPGIMTDGMCYCIPHNIVHTNYDPNTSNNDGKSQYDAMVETITNINGINSYSDYLTKNGSLPLMNVNDANDLIDESNPNDLGLWYRNNRLLKNKVQNHFEGYYKLEVTEITSNNLEKVEFRVDPDKDNKFIIRD